MKIFSTILITLSFLVQVQAQTVVINEFVASSDSLSGISDPAGGFPDWIEIYNTSGSALDLGGYMVSDTLTELDKFVFPAGSIIETDGYIIIWADKDLEEEGFHADFRLKAEGEEIYLSDPDGNILDSVTFGQQETNVAMARIPNGTGDFVPRAPTHGYNNEATSSNNITDKILSAVVSPNPTNGEIVYNFTFSNTFEKKSDISLQIYDIRGIFVQDLGNKFTFHDNEISGSVDLSGLSNGFYYFVLETNKSVLTKKFLIQK